LRLKKTDKIILFNWKNNIDYIYQIIEINKKNIFLNLIDKIEKENLNINEINLFQALTNKISKLELILQKWVEVGIKNFYFFSWERTQNFFISDNKKERLKKIVIEAIEQSWQNKIPKIYFLKDKNEAIIFAKKTEKNLNLFFHTKNNNSKFLEEIKFDNFRNINIFVWPEWWFSNNEIISFKKNNFLQIFLGNNILRTETVWIVVWFFIMQKNLLK
jgi:16S rRNA (uracil1498-N3)-methyltransferase